MAIRPPRASQRRPRSARQTRDVPVIFAISLVVVLFGLRLLMALIGLETWTIAWRVVDVPTGLLIDPLLRIELLRSEIVQRLTVADVVVAVIIGGLALFALSTLALRRR